ENFGPNFNDNTSYNYGAIGSGNYQVTNTTGLNGDLWHVGPDHTPGDVNGYMLLFDARDQESLFFTYDFPEQCEGSDFRARVWVSNINVPGSCGGTHTDPRIQIRIIDLATGQTTSTPFNPFPRTESSWWVPFDLDFRIFDGSAGIRMELYNAGGGGCGNDFAIDDVELYSIVREEVHDLCVSGTFTDSRGITYFTPQYVVDTLNPSQGGCLPIIVCTEIVGAVNELEAFVRQACLGDTVFYEGVAYTSSVQFTDTIIPRPCPSIRPVSITFSRDTLVTQEVNLCPGGSVAIGNSLYTEPGTYRDNLLRASGCDSIVETVVTNESYQIILLVGGVRIPLVEGDRPAEVQIPLGDSVEMNLLISGIEAPTVNWEMEGQLQCENCLSIWLRGIRSGSLDIAISSAALSCSPGFSIPIRVLPCDGAFVPNAFSPNLDGINDRFRPYLQDCVQEVMTFQVFDRWGGLVFEDDSTDIGDQSDFRGWDGRYGSKALPTGIYVYRLGLILV
ncbi:MAG: gliding motility-associated C-terminal domain-containing protein, partial [Bacteroidota bacterium]